MLRKVALAALAMTLAAAAYAADMGGSCCADLEERVAELEVTAARKGNRKVSVTVYGQVNKAIMWHDADVSSTFAKTKIGDGAQNPTFFGFKGEGKITPTVKAGFRLEFGLNDITQANVGVVDDLVNTVNVRHSNVWIESVTLGRLTLGRGSTATDGIVEITTANTDVAAKMLNLEPYTTNYLFGFGNLPFDGNRRDVIRYDSPSLGGFIVSASGSKGDNFGPLVADNTKDVWDVAVRYAGEFGGFRVAAGVGYRSENYATVASNGTSISGSASIKHMASGLFVNGAAGHMTDIASSGSGIDLIGMHGQAGWEKNVTDLGSTTLFGEWGQLERDGADASTMMGLGAVQAFDAAALDIYASWRRFDGDESINTFMGGARVRF